MRETASAALALCALAALAGRADDPEPPDDKKAELKKLKGTWAITRVVMEGKEWKQRSDTTYAFDGNKLVATTTAFAEGKGKFESTESFKVKIDTKKKPHTIDLVPDGKYPGLMGIYKIEKGELYIAKGWREGIGKAAKVVRPKDFKGDGVGVYVLTREKDKAK